MDRPQKLKFVYFNPRPREGGDGCRDDGYHRRLSISIHAPARGATPCRGKSRGDTWHFNPRPREGGDTSDLLWYTTHDISIHAPARGATCCYKHHRNGQAISIHAPARGATFKLGNGVGDGVISIHAPARGATAAAPFAPWGIGYFNPRPREGGDVIVPPVLPAVKVFQSTPPRGGRPGDRLCGYSATPNFNPRPREGGDSKDAQFYLRIFDKQVELLRFWGKMRGGCLRNPEKDRRFLGKSLANLPEISGHLDFAGA